MEDVMSRHTRIAFQYSGGKDSTAALLLMRPYWDRMAVYHCDVGDQWPETAATVAQMAELVPITVVPGRVRSVRATYGLPTDVVAWSSSMSAHQLNAGTTPLMQDWVSCCFRSSMEPMYERMVADRITLIIRGQKDVDSLKGPLRSGSVILGVEYLYPVEDWTDAECFAYMELHGFKPQRFYSEGMSHSGDCMHCTAWLGDDKAAYLKRHYPEEFPRYQASIRIIASAVAPHLMNLLKEAAHCEEKDHG